ncbi:MAG: serine protease [Saccharospirillaceae bacterium]|nr:serine protease [Pseudomonadales bacterium]NRB79857.1 serine protease [Saccharospirillaceae bacterium]
MRIVVLVNILLLTMLSLKAYSEDVVAEGISPKIIGGQIVEVDNSPYGFFARLYGSDQNSAKAFCGGAHIGNGIVLTAAHCLDSLHEQSISLRFPHDSVFKNEVFESLYIKLHPAFIEVELGYDVAIIKIKDKNGRYPETISLLDTSQYINFANDELLEVIGYGLTSVRFETIPTQLHRIEINKVPHEICEANYSEYDTIVELIMMCAAATSKDSCQGDSGGPLMYYDEQKKQYYHTGVVSFGNGCAEPEFPGIYTRTDYFNDWISEFIDKTIFVELNSTNKYLHTGQDAKNKVEIELSNFSLSDSTISTFNIDSQLTNDECGEFRNKVIMENESIKCEITLNGLEQGEVNDLQIDFSYLKAGSIITQKDEFPLYLLSTTIPGDVNNYLDDLIYHSWAESSLNPWKYNAYYGVFQSTAKLNYATSLLSVNGYFNYGIKFNFAMESELGYDLFYVTVDGVLQQNQVASGVCKKQSVVISVPAGYHRIAFIYTKDFSYNVGDDEVEISKFELLSEFTAATSSPHCFQWQPDEPRLWQIGSINIIFMLILVGLALIVRRKVA